MTWMQGKIHSTIFGLKIFVLTSIVCLNLIPQWAESEPGPGDAFLSGYIAALLDRDLHWARDSYRLKVVNGVATITVFFDDPPSRKAADETIRTIDGLKGLTIMVAPVDESTSQDTVARWIGITGDGETFPTGDLFKPLIADPKTPQFFVSFNRFSTSGIHYTMASVGFGETFGMYRFFGTKEGDGLQLSVEGALFAQFNMDAPSHDLINADYTIGIPATYRRGENTFRLRIYHQSSHLGDEFLQSVNPPDRVNLSYEAIEILYSLEYHQWRFYGGGEYLVHKEPDDLKPMSAHWGIEYRGSKPVFWGGRPIAGVDMKSFDEHGWAIDTSIKGGLEFGHPNPGQRRLRLIAEWYNGYDPRGQFYINSVEYYGLGLSLGF